MINVRSDTLLDKPSFKQAVQKRRCLIPANGFYEWRREGKRKVPLWIQFKNRQPLHAWAKTTESYLHGQCRVHPAGIHKDTH
jgi:putative SOS response-associated peptidase YedK